MSDPRASLPRWNEPQYRAERQDPTGLATSNSHGRVPGHSAASSLSSAFSEPTSPHSYNGRSYSPTPHQQHLSHRAPYEARGRAASHLPHQAPMHREDPAHSYGTHQRSYTLPSTSHPLPPHASYPAQFEPSSVVPHFAPNPYGASGPVSLHQQQPLPQYAPHGSGYPHDQRLRIDSANPYDPFGFSQGQYYGAPPHHIYPQRKRRGNLPKEATKIMKDWFHSHTDSPYPTEEEKQALCDRTKLQMSQVCFLSAVW